MSCFMVDIEADGPIPGKYSMIAIGAVVVKPGLVSTFRDFLCPISPIWDPEALAVSGFTREQTLKFESAFSVMPKFESWVLENNTGDRPRFFSDNNGFDAMFVTWYSHYCLGRCPFGYSSTNLGSLYRGLVSDYSLDFKHLRKAPLTHDPLEDAISNAEVLLHMIEHMGFRINLD